MPFDQFSYVRKGCNDCAARSLFALAAEEHKDLECNTVFYAVIEPTFVINVFRMGHLNGDIPGWSLRNGATASIIFDFNKKTAPEEVTFPVKIAFVDEFRATGSEQKKCEKIPEEKLALRAGDLQFPVIEIVHKNSSLWVD